MRDADSYRHPRPYMLALGRLVPEKGFHQLLQAVALAGMGMDVIIAGTGPELNYLKAVSVDLGLMDRVIFVGAADRSQVAWLHSGADWFILPSRADEGLPLAGLEALAAGSAMIATRTGGLTEVVEDGVHALLIDKSDVASMAACIRPLGDDSELVAHLKSHTIEVAGALDWGGLARRYLVVIEEARALRQTHD